jgi:demethylmenaquinone methyltransferase/2-methoxy-6-polyprenyl-1,4-benzoquinol methylase
VSEEALERLKGMDLDAHLGDASRKQDYVTAMFTVIAPRYDRFTRAFSYGMDRGWKNQLVDAMAARLCRGGRVADLACGTGDLARALAARRPDARVWGVDAATAMLARARAQPAAGVGWAGGDLMRLPFADQSLDGVLVGYGLRNAPDPVAALAECARVLAPNGTLGCLDFTRPAWGPWRRLFLGYLGAAGCVYGWWWHGHADVYRYIARSIDGFMSWRELSAAMRSHGLEPEIERPLLGGGLCLHVCRRRA